MPQADLDDGDAVYGVCKASVLAAAAVWLRGQLIQTARASQHNTQECTPAASAKQCEPIATGCV